MSTRDGRLYPSVTELTPDSPESPPLQSILRDSNLSSCYHSYMSSSSLVPKRTAAKPRQPFLLQTWRIVWSTTNCSNFVVHNWPVAVVFTRQSVRLNVIMLVASYLCLLLSGGAFASTGFVVDSAYSDVMMEYAFKRMLERVAHFRG